MSKKPPKETADVYDIRLKNSNTDSALIFVLERTREFGGHCGWISVVSPLGLYGHHFGNTGPDPFKRFLLNRDDNYLRGRLFGAENRVFDCEATLAALKARILRARRARDISEMEATDFQLHLNKIQAERHTRADAFKRALSNRVGRLWEEFELGECLITQPNPNAQRFWEKVWPQFTAKLRAELKEQGKCAA